LSSLEGRHDRIQLTLEGTLGELGKEIQGPALRDIIFVNRCYEAADEFEDAEGGRPIPLCVTAKSGRFILTQTPWALRHGPVVPDVGIRRSICCAI